MVDAFGSMAVSAPALDRRGFFAGVCVNGAGSRGAAAVQLSDYLLGVAYACRLHSLPSILSSYARKLK